MTEMVHWLLGSFLNRSMQDVFFVLPFIVTGIVLLLLQQKFFSALSLGEEVAQTLGMSLQRQRVIVIVAIALMIGASVSICGSIGFVGLVVPHLLRPLVHYDPARLLRVSALAGAAFLLLADLLVKLLATQQELKIGVVTSLVGAPFFLALILSVRKQVA
jgi:iron complex transport system permease protein